MTTIDRAAYVPEHDNGVFTQPTRIYNHDIDSGGVVGNYLKFMERARTEWLCFLGISLKSLEELCGIGFVVNEINVKYSKPVEDLLQVSVQVADLGRCSLTLIQTIRRDDELLCTASIQNACIDACRQIQGGSPPARGAAKISA